MNDEQIEFVLCIATLYLEVFLLKWIVTYILIQSVHCPNPNFQEVDNLSHFSCNVFFAFYFPSP